MSKYIAICGTFSEDGGKASGFMNKLFEGTNTLLVNGGNLKNLETLVSCATTAGLYEAIFWFANVDNSVKKYLPELKKKNPKCILVSSKNNSDNKYSHGELVARMLQTKSNLLLEVIPDAWKITATLHDPLGNVFIDKSNSVEDIRNAMFNRVEELCAFRRLPSSSIGKASSVPDEPEFFELIKKYADTFHTLIHAANQDRLLGNASFRCERGFPSYKKGSIVYVSRRNVDKRYISKDNFVPVLLAPLRLYNPIVEYFGDIKPSVDTPIQLKLYEYYSNIDYMLHSHTYIEGAPFTKHVVPCGAVEEYDGIIDIYPETDTDHAYINLRGHGSLVMVSSDQFDKLIDVPYISRPAPEFQATGHAK